MRVQRFFPRAEDFPAIRISDFWVLVALHSPCEMGSKKQVHDLLGNHTPCARGAVPNLVN